jgi:hypothetical protein
MVVISYDVNQKSSVASDASSSSGKCGFNFTAGSKTSVVKPVLQLEETTLTNPGIYPNPTTSTVIISTHNNNMLNERWITISDAGGRTYQVNITRRISANSIELNLSGLISGVYMVGFTENGKYKVVRIIKL